jgi:hypothetical protein
MFGIRKAYLDEVIGGKDKSGSRGDIYQVGHQKAFE